MGSEPSESPNWPYITHLANCRNRNSPIDSSDESELVSGQRRNLQWRCGRPQQQNPSGDQTILRLSHLRSHGNCPLSQLGAAPRTGISPQILLRRPQSVIVHTLRTTQTISTIRIMVPTRPKPSISVLLLIRRSTSCSEHAKDRRYLEGIVQRRAVIAVTHPKAWPMSTGSPSALVS